jgi:hypothetical protein
MLRKLTAGRPSASSTSGVKSSPVDPQHPAPLLIDTSRFCEQVNLSERTIGKYTSNILGKLHLANRTQAALYALRKGVANLDDE